MCPEEDGGCGGEGGVSASAPSAGPEGTAAASAPTALLSELRSWWEVPAIAHFCSLFRTAFRLPDFEIEKVFSQVPVDPHDHRRFDPEASSRCGAFMPRRSAAPR
ncbi:UNVERIFIED_CONTAM: hypothetical protein K2H54_075148 [Gekko kuhli]